MQCKSDASRTTQGIVVAVLIKTGQQTSVQAVLSEGKLISLLHQIVAAVDVGHPFKYHTVYTLYLADSKFGKIGCKCW